jgi:hypothetical protein
MGANILYVLAAHTGPLSIAAVITSLYPAGTVALAALVLHERLGRVPMAGRCGRVCRGDLHRRIALALACSKTLWYKASNQRRFVRQS